MPPVTVHNHVNSLHLIENRNIAHALSNFTEPTAAQSSSTAFQDGGQHMSITVGLNEVKDEDIDPKWFKLVSLSSKQREHEEVDSESNENRIYVFILKLN